jgi:putative Mg2+ transporter-C (MgtC) family protein
MEQQLIFSIQLIIAVFLGSALGWQRARWGKSAGPRTYALVTAGSALFTILSTFGFPGNQVAVNVAAGIVTGIGFLGIGLIFHKENHVEGLTTAAGLWMSAAIGMAVGLSFYILAIISTILIFFVFMLSDDKLEGFFRRR